MPEGRGEAPPELRRVPGALIRTALLHEDAVDLHACLHAHGEGIQQ